MKNFAVIVSLALLSMLLFTPDVLAVEGLRGSTWGELYYEIPEKGDSNLILDTWVRQGVDWVRWGDSLALNTYAIVRLKWDSEQIDWNNIFGPGIGVSLDLINREGINASWGVEYNWEQYYRSGESNHKVQIFMRWFGWWDLKK